MSALVSATFDNVSAAGGLHTLTESVNFTALSFFGLIGTFHFYTPLLFRSSFPNVFLWAKNDLGRFRDYIDSLYIKKRLLSTFFILFTGRLG